MAKGNLFLGMGRGKVGDVVFTRADGEQVTRVRNRHPRNPKSPLQLLQRVVMKTNSLAYSLMQDITDHSFQGAAEGTESQSRFTKINVNMLRTKLAAEIESGELEDILSSSVTNFASATDNLAIINPYVVSEGTIPSLPLKLGKWGDNDVVGFGFDMSVAQAIPTYQQVVAALGLQQGDQLTFLFFSVDDTTDAASFNGFKYARVILEPASGDMTLPFLSGGAVNDPNVKNQGNVTISFPIEEGPPGEGGAVQYAVAMVAQSPDIAFTAGTANTLIGCAAIASRLTGGVWARSTQSIVLRDATVGSVGELNTDHEVAPIGDAVYSYLDGTNSSLYLNQAQ